jgi:hypothetical protein
MPPPINVQQGPQPGLSGLRRAALAGQLAETPTQINPAMEVPPTQVNGIPMSELEADADQMRNAGFSNTEINQAQGQGMPEAPAAAPQAAPKTGTAVTAPTQTMAKGTPTATAIPLTEDAYVKATVDSVKAAHADRPAVSARIDQAAREEFRQEVRAQSVQRIAIETGVTPEEVHQIDTHLSDVKKGGPGTVKTDMDPDKVSKIADALKEAKSSKMLVPQNGRQMINGKEYVWMDGKWMDAATQSMEAPNMPNVSNGGTLRYQPVPGPGQVAPAQPPPPTPQPGASGQWPHWNLPGVGRGFGG